MLQVHLLHSAYNGDIEDLYGEKRRMVTVILCVNLVPHVYIYTFCALFEYISLVVTKESLHMILIAVFNIQGNITTSNLNLDFVPFPRIEHVNLFQYVLETFLF